MRGRQIHDRASHGDGDTDARSGGRSDEAHLAFASKPVTAEFVADIILNAMDKNAIEIFMPPERARSIRLLGTSPSALKKMIDRDEEIGADRLQARREAGAWGEVLDHALSLSI